MKKKILGVLIVLSVFFVFTTAQASSLKIGASSSAVTSLQQLLINKGYLKSAAPTGYFGTSTESAVEAFQTANGLTVDGAAGPKTLNLLGSDNAYIVPIPKVVNPALSSTTTNTTNTVPLCPNGNTIASNCTVAPTPVATPTLCPNGNTVASNCVTAPVVIPVVTPPITGCTSTSAPSITVTSPNGGETYTFGQPMTVTWSTCNPNPNDDNQIMIVLKSSTNSSSGNPMAKEIGAFPNTGTATFTVPTTSGYNDPLTSGNHYKITAQLGGSAMAHPAPSDSSDNTFTINSSTSCQTLYWTNNSDQSCATSKQFCGMYMYQGLHTFATQSACQASVTPTSNFAPGCTSAVGWSSTTGLSCGCNGTNYSTYDGQLCPTTPVTACAITSFTANPSTINSGGSSQLSYSTNQSCRSFSIPELNYHSLGVAGSQLIGPIYQNSTYTLKASNDEGCTGTNNYSATTGQACNYVSQTTTVRIGTSTAGMIVTEQPNTCVVSNSTIAGGSSTMTCTIPYSVTNTSNQDVFVPKAGNATNTQSSSAIDFIATGSEPGDLTYNSTLTSNAIVSQIGNVAINNGIEWGIPAGDTASFTGTVVLNDVNSSHPGLYRAFLNVVPFGRTSGNWNQFYAPNLPSNESNLAGYVNLQ